MKIMISADRIRDMVNGMFEKNEDSRSLKDDKK